MRDTAFFRQAENLLAVKWKLFNIGKMDPLKHKKAVHKLRDYLRV